MQTPSAFSSAQMKERDKRVAERHRKEISGLERKVENLKRSNDDTRKQLFDVMQRQRRLAESLGFENVFEAQETLDLMDQPMSFAQTLGRIQELEAELLQARNEAEEAQGKLDALESEHRLLKAEHDNVRGALDSIDDQRKRAGERYKRDHARWRKFSQWSAERDKAYRMQRNYEGITQEQKKQIDADYLDERQEAIKSIVPNLGRFVKEFDLDEYSNYETPRAHRIRRAGSPSSSTNPAQRDAPVDQLARSHPSTPPTLLSVRVPNSSDAEGCSQLEPPLQPIQLNSAPFKLPPLLRHISNSSDTEDDSQTISQQILARFPAKPVIRPPSPFKERIQYSSDTEDDSQFEPPPPSSIQKPLQPLTLSSGSNAQRRVVEPLTFSESPNKIRRIEVEDSLTPHRHDENSRPMPRTEPTKGHLGRPGVSTSKGKGRYAPRLSAPSPSTTINSRYIIDPSKNNGVDFQFDEVVRNRDARRNMDAGDCECCHDYYNAIGPLPARPQGPLWASPSNTPKRRCDHKHKSRSDEPDTPTRRQKEIDSHKKNISRHRHTWNRASTPPDYWNIGFPNTQEVGEINDKAEKMHQKKVQDIERDIVNGAGRYKRR